MTTTQAPLNHARVEAFATRALGDLAGTMTSILGMLGDRLGLFGVLAQSGPATSTELAERAGVSERYAREWLRGLNAAGYLEHNRQTDRFVLPPEHAQVLASEGGPFFIGGGYQALLNELNVIDRLTEAFRSGDGIPQSTYPPGTFEGQCRFSRAWYEHLLLPRWIPAVPGLKDKLEAGSSFADVGCGAGQALITLAQAFPHSTFVGYDSFDQQIEIATARAEETGLSDRIRFELLDAADGLPERYDIVSTFDVVHDATDPVGLLRGIRRALEPDGTYLLLEMNCTDNAADNVGPLATLLYGISILYCTPTALAQGGAGLGTCGCPPAKIRELCDQAGFSKLERVPVDNPFNILYAATP